LSDFITAIGEQQVGIRWYLRIQGIPFVFLSDSVPVGPTGTAWTAPTSKDFTVEAKENAIDLTQPLEEIGSIIDRRTGKSSPASLRVSLHGEDMLDLFAREKQSGAACNLEASVAYDTAGTGSVFTVDDNGAFDSAGYLYFGRETCHYTTKPDSTHFGDVGNKCTRDLFGIYAASGANLTDIFYEHEANNPSKAPRVLSDYPRVWHGRTISLWAYCVGPDGTAYDTGYFGAYSRECFRGVLQDEPTPDSSWLRWTLNARAIDSVLHTKVGGQSPAADLFYVPDGKSATGSGENIDDPDDSNYINFPLSAPGFLYTIDENNRDITFALYAYGNVSDYNSETGATVTRYEPGTLQLTTGLRTGSEIISEFNTIASAAAAAYGIVLGLGLHGHNTTCGVNRIRNATKAGYRMVRWDFDTENNFGKLFGFHGVRRAWLRTDGTFTKKKYIGAQMDGDGVLVGMISETATTIPFFLPPSGGVGPSDIPSSGYARLGEKEIIKYEAVAQSIADTPFGMYKLTGVQRGAMGTARGRHEMRVDRDNWHAVGERGKLQFGVGFDDESFFDVFLKLCVSTGSGHHGSYDTLPKGWGLPLNPNDFDITEIEKIRDSIFYPHRVRVFLSKPIKIVDWIADWLAPVGMYITARTNSDGNYLLTIAKITGPLESDGLDAQFGAGEVDLLEPVRLQPGIRRVINQITASIGWNVTTEKLSENTKIVVTDTDSVVDFGKRGSVSWKFRGFFFTTGIAIQHITAQANRAFRRFARPYDVLKIDASRAAGFQTYPGAVVSVTLPGVPNRDGSRGLSYRLGTVLGVNHRYWQPGGAVGSEVTVALEPYVRTTTYSPSARVTNAASTTITVAPNDYTAAPDTDLSHFEAGDVVQFYNLATPGTSDDRTIVSVSTSTLVINSSLSITPGSLCVMVSQDHDAAIVDAQKRHAFLSDTGAPPELSGSTESFKYV